MAGESSFCKAKVFRRTGRHSYAVQLEGSPGVVHVHCVDEDWGHMTATMQRAEDLEERLCAIGTRSMFAWDAQAARMAPVRAQPLEPEEGVQIELGPYDPGRAAFVQCRLRVVEGATTKPGRAVKPASSEGRLIAAEQGEGGKKRVFKWAVWG